MSIFFVFRVLCIDVLSIFNVWGMIVFRIICLVLVFSFVNDMIVLCVDERFMLDSLRNFLLFIMVLYMIVVFLMLMLFFMSDKIVDYVFLCWLLDVLMSG